MACKLKDEKSAFKTDFKEESKEDIEISRPEVGSNEESIIIEVEELFGYTPGMENALEIDASIVEENENDNNTEDDENDNGMGEEEGERDLDSDEEKRNDTIESKASFECLEELFQDEYEIFASEQNNDNESVCVKQPMESEPLEEPADTNADHEDIVSQTDSFEEVLVTDSEYFENESKQSNKKAVSSNSLEESAKPKPRKSKHRQPRLELPLLEELKCRFCEQVIKIYIAFKFLSQAYNIF